MKKHLPYLSMNTGEAWQRIRNMEDLALVELDDKEPSDKKRYKEERKIQNRFFRYASIIADFEDGNFYRCKRNADHYRFYSIITQLPKPLRDLVSCKGKQLVQVDLTNAQFIMSVKLLLADTWRNRTKDRLHKRIWKDIACLKASYTEIAELVSILEYLDWEDQPYVQFLMEGKLYESLIEQFVATGHVESDWPHRQQRKTVKKLLIESMFDNTMPGNGHKAKRHALPDSVWNIFRRNHPVPVKIFEFIKHFDSGAYKDMARLLQRLEAIFMIDIVCKRLHQEYPKLDFYLLHDCIVTTVGNEALVEKVIKEEMKAFIGYEGQTETKEWHTYQPILFDFTKVQSAA